MLNNYKTFEKLMDLLRSMYPGFPLPEGLDKLLWDKMDVMPIFEEMTVLEREGNLPSNAYYVVRGKVIVEGFVDGLPFTESIYREHTILALNAFMKGNGTRHIHTITATKGTLLWTVSAEVMNEIYATWPEMRAMALQTALNYMEQKIAQRYFLLALPEDERVSEFYLAFSGLMPVRRSPIEDKYIASYLNMNIYTFRKMRKNNSAAILSNTAFEEAKANSLSSLPAYL